MQETGPLWKKIEKEDHKVMVFLMLGDRIIDEDDIFSVRQSQHLFSGDMPELGGAVCGSLEAEFLPPSGLTIPRMGPVSLWAYLRSEAGERSENLCLGQYFIDTRQTNHRQGLDTLQVVCYDAMLKTEAPFPDFGISYPASDLDLVSRIAEHIGVTVDPRTSAILTQNYQIPLPIDYSMREVLSEIAKMYAGTFVISKDHQLRLVQIADIPKTYGHLVTENGAAITFGGVRIVVS